MYKAIDVAAWFINRAIDDSVLNGEFMTPLKVQKLLYYSQGFHKVLTGEKLFKEKILAWQYGPVVQEVFNELRCYNSSGISDGLISVKIDDETEKVLNLVYNNFNQFSAGKLVSMTHNETPWVSTEQNSEIKVDIIEDYFKKAFFKASG